MCTYYKRANENLTYSTAYNEHVERYEVKRATLNGKFIIPCSCRVIGKFVVERSLLDEI